ncbi:MAG: MATE family efflux transporter [Bacteroidales bacterium]|nr:MATE family efflux transporter [Bacteroidales bacterium]
MKIELSGHYGYRKLVGSSLPAIAMMLVGGIYSIVDGLFVSNFVGTTAFAALNVIWPPIMVIGALGLMIGTGGSALVSMTLGQGDKENANRYFSMLIRFTLILALVMAVPLFLFMEPLARLMGAEGEMLRQCVIYGRICAIGLPGFMLQMAFQSLYMTAEKPQLGTVMSIACALINMSLDALFIVGFGWGLAGAALASMSACFVGGFFPLWYFSSSRNTTQLRFRSTPLEKKPILSACSNGLSEFVGNISFNILAICYNLQLLRMLGENGVAAYSVILYYGYVFAAVFFGYNIAVTPVIGYHYGAENRLELKSLLRHSVILMLFVGVLMTVLAEASAPFVARIFVGYDSELMNLTTHAIHLYMLSFVIAGLNIFVSAWFTALNNGKISAIASFVRSMVFELGFVFLLPVLMGTEGIWWAVNAAEIMSLFVSAYLLLRFRRRYGY